MKKILFLAFCFLRFSSFGQGITLYENGGFGGASFHIEHDWDAFNDMKWNDKISSIRIPRGYKIQVFWDTRFGGKSMFLDHDWDANMNPEWNDQISSIKVFRDEHADMHREDMRRDEMHREDMHREDRPKITLFADGGYNGASIQIDHDWDAINDMQWNDRISSIRIPRGYKIQIFWDTRFGGKSMFLDHDWDMNMNPDWNDQISSIRVMRY